MPDIQHRANDDRRVPVPAAQDGGLREPGPTLGSTVTSQQELERLMSELRDDERVVVELVLECVKAQQAMTTQVLEWLRLQNPTSEALLQAVLAAPDAPEASPTPREDASRPPHAATGRSDEPSPVARAPGTGLISRWRRRARSCAVCNRNAPRTSSRELANVGWAVSGRTGICPDCRSAGWRVSDRGGLPFRPRGSGASGQ